MRGGGLCEETDFFRESFRDPERGLGGQGLWLPLDFENRGPERKIRRQIQQEQPIRLLTERKMKPQHRTGLPRCWRWHREVHKHSSLGIHRLAIVRIWKTVEKEIGGCRRSGN